MGHGWPLLSEGDRSPRHDQRTAGTAALVTGASSGIGEATARMLAAQGATVAVVARRKERLDALAAQIDGLAIEADVTDRDQAVQAVERAAGELGRLDIVVNNAGVMLLGPIVDAPVDYQLTKHGVGVFSEALRQEITGRYVRSSLIEPGATESELLTHVREEIRAQLPANEQKLAAEDIADAILYIVTRPRHVAVNELLVRRTEQVR